MIKKNVNILFNILTICVFFVSYSQDDGLTLLKDADDNLIKFENHYFEALKYKATGNYNLAIIELEKCQQIFKNDASISFELSKNYYRLQKFDEAKLYIEKALAIDSNNYWYLNHLKEIYVTQHQIYEAIEIQDKLMKLNPKVEVDIIPLYIKIKDYEKALFMMDKLEKEGQKLFIFDRYKEVIDKNINLNNNKSVKKNSLTLEELKEQFEKEKKYVLLSDILNEELKLNNYDNLSKFSNEGLSLFPAQPTIYLMNAIALINQEKYTDAIDVLNTGIDFVIDNTNLLANFHQQLAKCYQALNQPKKANEHLTKENKYRKE